MSRNNSSGSTEQPKRPSSWGVLTAATTAATLAVGEAAFGAAASATASAAPPPLQEQTQTAETLEATHQKRLAMILRFISTMHHSNNSDGKSISFVHDTSSLSESERQMSQHYHQQDVLFTTSDFRHIMAMDPEGALFASPPFSFYAAATSGTNNSRKRTFGGAIKDSLLSSKRAGANVPDGRPCWLRLTRIIPETPPSSRSPCVQEYLNSWLQSTGASSLSQLFTLDRLSQAPKIAPSLRKSHVHQIKSFLRQMKKYLRRKIMRRSLEPLYNRLFEWLQQGGGSTQELVWGFGNASMLVDRDSVVEGPVLEVLVEVELSRDGALLVRPRPHTGVALNREVVSALVDNSKNDHGNEILSNLHRTVSELETFQLSPGQPSSYTSLLKRMALELSPGGSFVISSSSAGVKTSRDRSKLVVTDSWCLFHRPKPSTVWARDASVLAEQVMRPNMPLPAAAWSLTHGPGVLQTVTRKSELAPPQGGASAMMSFVKSALWLGRNETSSEKETRRPLLPLPTSAAQNRIADLLLVNNAPAVVCEGPPGTGKTHTIANMVCAYLCQGKRVLVTSKGSPALSVLRQRLPKCVQELCVDVSLSESTGMRQLQQTVERLADRVSCISTEVQEEQCQLLQRNIRQLEMELEDIDAKLEADNERKRALVQSGNGQELIEIAMDLVDSVPWMMTRTAGSWTVAEANGLLERAKSLFVQPGDPMDRVSGYASPPSRALVSLVALHAGESLSYLKNAATQTLASVPFVGHLTKMDEFQEHLQEALAEIKIDGCLPSSKMDWKLVLLALQQEIRIYEFHETVVESLIAKDGWLEDDLYEQDTDRKRLRKDFVDNLVKLAALKEFCWKQNAAEEIERSVAARQLDTRRSKITMTMQRLAEDLVEATVVTELARMFSEEAQSALIRFAQIAGKAKFSRSSQTSKMSQRQRRHRQEYLDAFEKCVRYIPCWIMTSSQISDYLPAEFGLFDLVIIDEASQSDSTALPGIMRGKQWLIVGDGKQVSPSESFVSEARIESLRAALPESPLEDSLLPGHSLFDLCSQAFPSGRVVLSEHFRCAPEIIVFSNEQFYNSRLIPLRLPTSSERLQPSIIDVHVRNATKVGKINEKECDTVVAMIRDFVSKSSSQSFPRSIGVISLIGDEQSRLIRGRLLDAIGPQKFKEFDILVGDPPTFQGAERDIIFLSMICSPGSVPAQSQLMHAQRVNVALSRARDRMVLVRSIDANQIPSQEDIKLPILEFFAQAGQPSGSDSDIADEPSNSRKNAGSVFTCREQAENMLEGKLQRRGYSTRRMGIVWNDAICVENDESGRRAAICVDGAGESTEQWRRLVTQQKSIERVGWKCIRIDALTFLIDHSRAIESIEAFLREAGVDPVTKEEDIIDDEIESEQENEDVQNLAGDREVEIEANGDAEIVVISSDEDDSKALRGDSRALMKPEVKVEEDAIDPAAFGDVVDLEFLKGDVSPAEDLDDPYDHGDARRLKFHNRSRQSENEVIEVDSGVSDNEAGVARAPSNLSEDYQGDASEEGESDNSRPRKRRRKSHRRRLDKYSRDGRWYPGRNREDSLEWTKEWYDTESDLEKTTSQSFKTSDQQEEEDDSY